MKLLLSFLKIFLSVSVFVACSTIEIRERKSENTVKDNQITDVSFDQAEEVLGDFPIVRNSDVEKWIVYFQTKGRRTFSQWMKQGGFFREAIEESLKNENVPVSLYYLSLIESGFVHHAESEAKASGPWQFMRDTGRLYGLESNSFIDERRDPVKSTHAAAAYLRDLRKKFGDWYLAVAAYNGGPRTIQDAIKKTGSRDFWVIKKAGLLKKQTGDFVPKMIAAVIIGNDPESFGIKIEKLSDSVEFPDSVVKAKYPVKLSDIAKKLSIPLSKLKEWNPELIKGVIPERTIRDKNVYALRLSEDYHQKYYEIEPELSKIRLKQYRLHKMLKGETLAKIARQYQVPLKELLKANPKMQAKKLKVGSEISIPYS